MEIIIGRSANVTGILLKSFSTLQNLKTFSNLRCLCQCDHKKWNFTFYETKLQHRTLTRCILPLSNSIGSFSNARNILNNRHLLVKFSNKTENEASKDKVNDNQTTVPKKVNVFQKMKQLAKDYWHVLIPVHIMTSLCWISIFYVAAKNGVDVIGLMEYLHMPEKYIDIIKNSGAGHWAVIYALYKIFTPLRYTITVAGTTMAIRHLDKMGYMKFKLPLPKTTSSTKSNITLEKTSQQTISTSAERQRKN